MSIVLKSVSLNLLEPSGPVQACNGIALPFIFPGNSPVSEFYMPTFRNTLSVPSLLAGSCRMNKFENVGVSIGEKVWLENSLSQ